METKEIRISTVESGKARATVLIIYTGGTFGMNYDKDGVLVPFDFASIVDQLPALRNLQLDITVVSFSNPIDSSNIEPTHWIKIATILHDRYNSFDGFVVLHGTDTMAYTASALSFMLQGLAKPVVFTGAQLPIGEPRSDARENLITALDIASASIGGRPVVPEVAIYFDYVLLRGNRSKKVESMQFDAFDSGNYPPLAKAGVKIDYNHAVIRKPTGPKLALFTKLDTQLVVLKLFPGISRQVVNAIFNIPGLNAVVLETFGSGNAPTFTWLKDEIQAAISRDIIMVNVSQCPGGMVIQGRYETSRQLLEAGVISGKDLTTEAALTKLMVTIGQFGKAKARELLQTELAGEIS